MTSFFETLILETGYEIQIKLSSSSKKSFSFVICLLGKGICTGLFSGTH